MSDGIRPFRVEIPQADLYLHDRLGNARWPASCPAGVDPRRTAGLSEGAR